ENPGYLAAIRIYRRSLKYMDRAGIDESTVLNVESDTDDGLLSRMTYILTDVLRQDADYCRVLLTPGTPYHKPDWCHVGSAISRRSTYKGHNYREYPSVKGAVNELVKEILDLPPDYTWAFNKAGGHDTHFEIFGKAVCCATVRQRKRLLLLGLIIIRDRVLNQVKLNKAGEGSSNVRSVAYSHMQCAISLAVVIGVWV
ncbi:hypothetical protein KIPB_015391, partial [Kipferlia bialata]